MITVSDHDTVVLDRGSLSGQLYLCYKRGLARLYFFFKYTSVRYIITTTNYTELRVQQTLIPRDDTEVIGGRGGRGGGARER